MTAFLHREIVRFGQVDGAGIVYYPRIHEWITNTVEAWFTEALDTPWHRLHVEQRRGTPIVEGRIKFHRPSRLGDQLEFSLVVEDLGRHTFDLAVTLRCNGEERVEAWVRHIWVCLDPLAAEPLPDWLRQRMERFRAQPGRAG